MAPNILLLRVCWLEALTKNEVKTALRDLFVANPGKAVRLAKTYGLYDWLYETIIHPVHMSACRHEPNLFIEYIMTDPETGSDIIQQPFQREWQQIISDYKRVLIAAPRSHGKCCTAGTKLILRDNTPKEVSTLPIGVPFETLSWTEELGYTWQWAKVWQSTKQTCYKITTRSGRTTEYSEEHPCWTDTGWVAAKDLQVGNRFGVARGKPHGSVAYDLIKARILGYALTTAIPEDCFTWDSNSVQALLQGYVETGKYRSTSRKLQEDMQSLLLRFNTQSYIIQKNEEYELQIIPTTGDEKLFWDEIVSVEYTGMQQTYSVEVENTHIHITDDFVTHNSIQLVGRLTWELGNNHELRIIILGSSSDNAQQILGLVSELVKSDRCKEVFPDLIIDTEKGDRKDHFFVKRKIAQRDPSVSACGILEAGAGKRADLLICDDVVDSKNAITNPAMREQITRQVKETWFSLVSSKGRVVWIGTPYHIADCTHNLKNNPEIWKIWWTPAIKNDMVLDEFGEPVMEAMLDEDGNTLFDPIFGKPKMRPKTVRTYLWPDKWGEEALRLRRLEVGERTFSRQYLLNAMSDEERTFPEKSIIKSFDYELLDIGDGVEDDWPTFGGVDLASSMGKKAAWTVIWTLARNPHNKRLYLKDVWRQKATFVETIAAIEHMWEKHHWRFTYVENNGYQTAVINSMGEDKKWIPIQGFHTSATGKFDEKVGLPGMCVAFERGLFAIPAGRFDPQTLQLSAEDDSDLAVFMGELRAHPGGEWSDTIMALWFAYRAAIEGQSDFESAYLDAIAGVSKPEKPSIQDLAVVDRTTPYKVTCTHCKVELSGRGRPGLCPICNIQLGSVV